MKWVIVRVLFLHKLSCSEGGLHDVEAGRNVAQTERCAFSRSLRCGYGLACDIAYENSLAGVRRPIGLRSPSNRIAFAVQSNCVRRPIGLRSPSNRVASAVQSDCVRRPIGLRPPSDQIASAVRLYNHRMYTLSTKSDSNTYCCLLRRPETSATAMAHIDTNIAVRFYRTVRFIQHLK